MKMSENCSGNCASCSSNCSSRKKESFIEPTGEFNNIKHVVAVVSGKGGVGKSTVTSMLAVAMARRIRASEQLCAVDKWYSTAGSTPLEPQVGVVTIVLPLAFSSLVARAYAYNFALLLTAALYDIDLFR